MLQAKEQARLQRAKERAKLKKLQRQQQQLPEQDPLEEEDVDVSHDHHLHNHHERSNSQPVSLSAGGRAESRQSRQSEGGRRSFDENGGRHSRTSANSRSFDENVRPPARRPYMNPGAIDSHRSEFAVRREGADEDDVEDEANDGSDEEEPDEPQ